MGNRVVCGAAPQTCVDECARLQFETRSRDADEPECDPAGTVFQETLQGLSLTDQEGLRFASTANLVALRWLLLLGANAKARDRNNTTMLHAACRSGSFLVAQELVNRGLPLDAADSAGWTPLHVAATMGRRDLTLLLLQKRCNPSPKNKRGMTPLILCSDLSTRDVLLGTLQELETPTRTNLADFEISAKASGDMGVDPSATCEPFFVPRQAMYDGEEGNPELIRIGLEMSCRSAGHALAFFVATGVVHDHPTDLSAFCIEHKVDPIQLGEFMGEDFSLAQTLRLAFVHTMELQGTGVITALRKVFRFMRPPNELSKVDRICMAAAHLWWRTHEVDDYIMDGPPEAPDGSQWTFSEDIGLEAAKQDLDSSHGAFSEVTGTRLRAALKSVEGLARLMFSSILLCWNIHRVKLRGRQEDASPRRLQCKDWMNLNSSIEADGSTPPEPVQRGIYKSLVQDKCHELLPGFKEADKDPEESKAGADYKGWASIPPGGLERHEAPMTFGVPTGSPGPKLAHCILSETSSSYLQHSVTGPASSPPQPEEFAPGEEVGEAVWLSLAQSKYLFLATSPQDPAPYAFIRLQDAALRDVSSSSKHLVLAGRKHDQADDLDLSSPQGAPFGDATRMPLPLCFLLADGRFQTFEAMWLELQFSTSEELDAWASMLGGSCAEVPPSLMLKAPATQNPTAFTPRMNPKTMLQIAGDKMDSRDTNFSAPQAPAPHFR